MSTSNFYRWLVLGVVLSALVSLSNGQTPAAEVTGLVTDSTGAVVPGASITVANLEKGFERETESNNVGYYRVPLLEPGQYRATAQAEGFSPLTKSGITLEVDQVARIDFVLQVGEIVETVEVSAAATLIQSENTNIGQVIDNKRIVEMPLNKRNYLELARFTVGVLPGSQLGRGEPYRRRGRFPCSRNAHLPEYRASRRQRQQLPGFGRPPGI